jgi:nitrile hydratase accessory protein
LSPLELDEAPVFAEPWQAEAFALAVALHKNGLFTWPEWAAALAEVIAEHPEGGEYYRHWLEALERIVQRKGAAEKAHIDGLARSWQRAAEATPHGRPIMLANDPLRHL